MDRVATKDFSVDAQGGAPRSTERDFPPSTSATTPLTPSRASIKPTLSPLTIPKPEHRLQILPPRDTGWQAWRVLIAATVVSSFISGFYLAFGVFHAYYEDRFSSHSSSAWIGVLSSGLPFLGAPVLTYMCTHLSIPRIHYVWLGVLICIIGLIAAAFSPSIPALIATQGLIFGIGLTINDNPLMIIVNTWFLTRRGLAYGILFGCCDLFGVAWSFLGNYLLQQIGLRKTLLVFSAIILSLPGPCILLLRERGATSILRRASTTSTSRSKTSFEDAPFSAIGGNFDLIRRNTPPTRRRFFQRALFYVLAFSNLFQAFAAYLPFIYLPSFTADLGHTPSRGAVVLAVANFAQIIGEIGFGKLSDHVSVHILIVVCTAVASLSTFVLWGFAHSFGTLAAYALMYGVSSSGYISLWARMGTLFGERDAQMVYSVMCAGRGLGSIASGPISSALLTSTVSRHAFGIAKYQKLVLFVGIVMALSSAMGGVSGLMERGPGSGRKRMTSWFRGRKSDNTTTSPETGAARGSEKGGLNG